MLTKLQVLDENEVRQLSLQSHSKGASQVHIKKMLGLANNSLSDLLSSGPLATLLGRSFWNAKLLIALLPSRTCRKFVFYFL